MVATRFVKGTQVTRSELPVAGWVEAGKQDKPEEANVTYLEHLNSAMDMEFEDEYETLLSSSKLFGLISDHPALLHPGHLHVLDGQPGGGAPLPCRLRLPLHRLHVLLLGSPLAGDGRDGGQGGGGR